MMLIKIIHNENYKITNQMKQLFKVKTKMIYTH